MQRGANTLSHTAIDTAARVETPEHVVFEYRLAGPTRRALAYLIDLAIRVGLVALVFVLLSLIESSTGLDGFSVGVFLVFHFALEWLYFVAFETLWSGRSPGKRVLGLRVVGQDGRSLTMLDSMLRNLLRAADFLPFGYAVGLVIMGGDPLFRRLGDMVAGTIVVTEDPGRIGERLQLEPRPTAAELDALPVRPPVSRVELEAIELFLRRHGALSAARERELAELLAPTLARRLGVRLAERPGEAGFDPVRLLGLVYARARGQSVESETPGGHS